MGKNITPASIKQVRIGNSLLGNRMRTIIDNTIPYQWNAMNDLIPGAEHSGSVKNFKIAAGEAEGEFTGFVFQDSDLAKWIEGAAYSLASKHDNELEKKIDSIVDTISKAQRDDGYLDTYFIIKEPSKRWTNLRDCHELYCAGHMIEAGVAYYQVSGKRKLLDIVCRFADYIDSVFGPEEGKKKGYPGHEEIELALIKLYHVTGERRYLNLSKYFIDERGKRPYYFDEEALARGEHVNKKPNYEYHQAHMPVREQQKAVGHAVRAMYLYSGMADVAAETGDMELCDACRRLWNNVTERQMYITGGIGSSASNGEAFTFDYDLPNDTAYTETCASIGLVLFSHRMLNLDMDGKYADVMERALYNGVLSGMNLDGNRFFYVNPLEVWPEACHKRRDKEHVMTERQRWYGCACCPPNIVRLLTSIGTYTYSIGEDELYVHLYVDSKIDFEISGRKVTLYQKTNYPWDENAVFTVDTKEDAPFTLSLRIPGWCTGVTIFVNGQKTDVDDITHKGYAKLNRIWRKGDKVEIIMPMPVERIAAVPSVRADNGKVAIQRGPVVYCLEEVDNGDMLSDISLLPEPELKAKFDENLLGGVVVVTGNAERSGSSPEHMLYRKYSTDKKYVTIKAVPYYSWNNRGAGEMLVWIRQS